MEVG
ncbi:hypothetical protein AYI68_g4481, partial [Smittium mucronatum]|jgi:hypothetical protein